jgi:Protein of unknown function (DUF4236)
MGLCFWRHQTLAPGLKINLSRSGLSFSLRRSGVWFTTGGARGSLATIGVPGTGL